MKGSSRKGELRKEFKVKEMSSISTLEVAWEHKSVVARMTTKWKTRWTSHISATRVAQTNKLELLKWATRGEKV